ncbi:hypothetical protein HY214_02660 [Candidatus Roizmanbacteria bacterium]|nr:hypothetical protein [Candidatus Roizmanbacteria bacterium]
MDKSDIIKKLTRGKSKDYTYSVAFFLTFSFFAFFVIRPNVSSVFKANSKIEVLKKVDHIFETQIRKIIDLQTSFENYRDKLYLLQEAVSAHPKVNKILSDVTEAANKYRLAISKVNIADINLKDTTKDLKMKAVSLKFDTTGDFADMISFMQELTNQRRLKLIKGYKFYGEESFASSSGRLHLKIEMEGYYL